MGSDVVHNTNKDHDIIAGSQLSNSKMEVQGNLAVGSNINVDANLNVRSNVNIIGNLNLNENANIFGKVGIGTQNPLSDLHIEGNNYIQGRVGIGSSNPQSKLDVDGTINSDNLIIKDSGNIGSESKPDAIITWLSFFESIFSDSCLKVILLLRLSFMI